MPSTPDNASAFQQCFMISICRRFREMAAEVAAAPSMLCLAHASERLVGRLLLAMISAIFPRRAGSSSAEEGRFFRRRVALQEGRLMPHQVIAGPRTPADARGAERWAGPDAHCRSSWALLGRFELPQISPLPAGDAI